MKEKINEIKLFSMSLNTYCNKIIILFLIIENKSNELLRQESIDSS